MMVPKMLILIPGVLALTACGGGVKDAQLPLNNEAADAIPTNLAEANASTGGLIRSGEGDTEFRVSWPAVAAGIAPLNALLRADAEKLQQEVEAGIRAEQASAKDNDYPFRGYNYAEDWAIAADVPAMLILRSEGYSYTGGAHGMPVVKTYFWDKAGARKIAAKDVFDEAMLGRAVKDRFCKALDAQREEKRGEPAGSREPSPISEFDACVDPIKQMILPVSTQGRGLDMIHFVIMPYEAGPYSEGIYEIEVPVDAAVLNAVKPAYKSAFTAN